MIDWGLGMVSGEPRGNILATAAEEAKEPFQRYSKSKSESEAARYVSEADMFKTLIGAQADVLGSEGGGKTYADLEKIKKIELLKFFFHFAFSKCPRFPKSSESSISSSFSSTFGLNSVPVVKCFST